MKPITLILLLALANSLPITSAVGQTNMIASANNPDPKQLPSLGVWEDPRFAGQKLLMVSATFPNVPDLICDSYCYESAVDFLGAKPLDGGRLELRHRVRENPHVRLVTVVTPEPGAIEFLARCEVEQPGTNALPEQLLTPALCWQLYRSKSFGHGADPYPEFIKRCFIFTDKGRTFLDKTTRRKIPCRSADHEYNNPPWVQMYAGAWQEIPRVGTNDWSDYSTDRYTTRIMGAVSRDGRYLTAIASDSATVMAQAWHDCMHNNAQWQPADAPPAERRWRLKIYAMENDPDALLKRVARDFPAAAQPGPKASGQASRVMLLGDSTVWGSYPRLVAPRADHLEDVIRKLLAAEPDLPPVEVINKGQDNDTIQRLLVERYDADVARQPQVDFIFVRYGINDRSYLTNFFADFPRTYHELIGRLRRDHPSASITLETIIPYRDEKSTGEVNALIREIATAERLPVLDTHARYAAELKHGPDMLSYRLLPLDSVPAPYRALLPAGSIVNGATVCVLDNTMDAHLRDVPGWFADRHPNLAGYQVIGSELAKHVAPLIRNRVAAR